MDRTALNSIDERRAFFKAGSQDWMAKIGDGLFARGDCEALCHRAMSESGKLREDETLWDGEVYTDDEFARRFSARPSDVAARTFSKDITYTMLEALVDKSFTVAFNQKDEFGWLNVHVHRKGQQVDLRLDFGPPDHAAQEATPSVCWNVIRSPVNVEASQPAAFEHGKGPDSSCKSKGF